jgi:hypothetical protein
MPDITVTVQQLVMIIGGIAALLTSISIIWKHINKVKRNLDDRLESVIKEVVIESNQRQDERTTLMLQNLKDMMTTELRVIETKIVAYANEYTKNREEELSMIQLLKDGLIEAYKNDIRTIYYTLRDTGEITDANKAYIDKIFPKYIAIGGNSDIQAKYEEISRVYERRTQEKYDETFKKTRKKKVVEKVETLEVKENEQ